MLCFISGLVKQPKADQITSSLPLAKTKPLRKEPKDKIHKLEEADKCLQDLMAEMNKLQKKIVAATKKR